MAASDETTLGDDRPTADDVDVKRTRAAVLGGLFGEGEPARIDRFTVLGTAGRGGMGRVYSAYDPDLDRKVAIKLIHSGGGDTSRTESRRKRLVREARAMAKLSHPNVIQIYEVGTHGEEVFLAMEFVEGETLKAWAKGGRRSWEEVVEVYSQAGRGLAAAHDAGLVHRDFKPANVMLGKDGRVRVLDFGLAISSGFDPRELQSTHRSGTASDSESQTGSVRSDRITRTGAAVGTLAYMAPEQFAAEEVDARSDQFSFCVALYEALYGERPFEVPDFDTLADGVPAPTGVVQPVPAPIHAAVARGLAPQPLERHESMHTLLEALTHRPWHRRPTVIVAGAMGLIGAAALGLAPAGDAPDLDPCPVNAELVEAWDPHRREQAQRALAADGGPSDETQRRILTRMDAYGSALLEGQQQACRATHVEGIQSDAMLDLRTRCLHRRASYFDAVAGVLLREGEERVDKPLEAVAALPRIEDCADVEQLGSEAPMPGDPATRDRIAELSENLATLKVMVGAGEQKAALDDLTALTEQARSLGYAPLTARSADSLATAHDDLGDDKAATNAWEETFEEALAGGLDPLAAEVGALLTSTLGELGDPERSRRWARRTDALIRREGDDPRLRLLLLRGEGVALYAAADFEGARQKLEQALEIDADRDVAEPTLRATLHHNLARALNDLGDHEGAMRQHQAALDLTREILGPRHPSVGKGLHNLAITQDRMGRPDLALQTYEEALSIQKESVGPDNPYVAITSMSIANIHARREQYDEAAKRYDDAIRILTLHDNPNLHIVYNNYATLERNRDFDRSRELYRKSLELVAESLGEDHREYALTLRSMGVMERKAGNYAESLRLLRLAMSKIKAAQGPNHPDIGNMLGHIADVQFEQGQFSTALATERESLAVVQEAYGAEHVKVADQLEEVAAVELSNFSARRAVELYERALEIRRQAEDEPIDIEDTRFLLATAVWRVGEKERAREMATRARASAQGLGDGASLVEKIDTWLAQIDQSDASGSSAAGGM